MSPQDQDYEYINDLINDNVYDLLSFVLKRNEGINEKLMKHKSNLNDKKVTFAERILEEMDDELLEMLLNVNS